VNEETTWLSALHAYRHPRVITMLFLGFSAGLPLLLIFSTLSLWMREAEVSRSSVTYFSWAALGYSFKFIWAPLVDRLPVPFLSARLGRRRGWLLLAQICIILAIISMALIDPASHLVPMALAAVFLGFSGATQDIVIDAYRIESADQRLQALMASTYIAGYRIGMLVAGAGALKLASWFGTGEVYIYTAWQWTYFSMAAVMSVGIATTLLIKEPSTPLADNTGMGSAADYARFLVLFVSAVSVFAITFFQAGKLLEWIGETGPLVGFALEAFRLISALSVGVVVGMILLSWGVARRELLEQAYFDPISDFFSRYGRQALLILALIGLYRVSDIVLGVISNVFYQDMGFTKDQIANITKVFGLTMTILGSFLGGFLALRFGVLRILFAGAVLSAATNLLFMLLAQTGNDPLLLVVVIAADNLSAGMAVAAFVAYLSGLTSIAFTAFQYALFSSLMTLAPKLLGGYSGTMVDSIGYEAFFLFTAVLGLPVLVLIYFVDRFARVEKA